jgi:phage terminase small subunit
MQSVEQELEELEQMVTPKRAKKKPAGIAKGTRHAPTIVLDSNLTPEQEAYCRAISLGMSRQEAMQLAGIANVKKAREWERSPNVRTRITELTEAITHNSIIKNGLDRGWVISRLMTVTERCMQAEPVLDKDGEPTGQYKFDSTGANRALELLGKTMRMFDAKDTSKQDEYAHLSDDEIARIASELAAQTGLLQAPVTYDHPPTTTYDNNTQHTTNYDHHAQQDTDVIEHDAQYDHESD